MYRHRMAQHFYHWGYTQHIGHDPIFSTERTFHVKQHHCTIIIFYFTASVMKVARRIIVLLIL